MITSLRKPKLSRLWWTTAIGGAIALALIAFLPVDSVQRSIVARGVGMAATALFFVGFASLQHVARKIWIWVGAFLVLTVVTDIIFDFQSLVLDVQPFPGITDVLYIIAFACALIGLIIISRRLNPSTGVASWIDVSIVVISASTFIGVFVINAMWSASDRPGLTTALDLLYPLLSLILLTVLVRLFILPHPQNMAIRWLGVAGLCFLLRDLIFSNELMTNSPGVAVELLWTAGIICIPLAVLSSTAGRFESVDEIGAGEVTATRQLLIFIGAIAVPVLVLLELWLTGTLPQGWLLPVILVVIALVFLRLHLLMRISQRQSGQLAEIAWADSLTGLPNRQSWERVLQEHALHTRGSNKVCTIAMMDVDNFAQHRESKTEHHSNLLLIALGVAWLNELESGDVLARCGIDEFSLLILRDSVPDAQDLLRRVLRATPNDLTVSVGAAIVRANEDAAEAAIRATSALRAAMSRPRSEIDHDIST